MLPFYLKKACFKEKGTQVFVIHEDRQTDRWMDGYVGGLTDISVDLIQLLKVITVWGFTLRHCHKLFVE